MLPVGPVEACTGPATDVEVKKCKASGSDPQSSRVQDARRDLAEAKLQGYIERTVALRAAAVA